MNTKLTTAVALGKQYNMDRKTIIKRLTDSGVKPYRVVQNPKRTFMEWAHGDASRAIEATIRHDKLLEERRSAAAKAKRDAIDAAKAKREAAPPTAPAPLHVEAVATRAMVEAQSHIGSAILDKLSRMQAQLNTIEHAVTLLARELGGITVSMGVQQ